MEDTVGQIYSYWIDADDIIVRVGENWQWFAQSNGAAVHCLSANVVGTSLWDHFDDSETSHLYEIILGKVRAEKQKAVFPFRCDAPDKRRFLELSVIPLDNSSIHFKSELIKTEIREPVELLDVTIERSEAMLRICSMCKKIAVSIADWQEAEAAIQTLQLFDRQAFPTLTHGICPACYRISMDELQRVQFKLGS